MTFPKGGVPAYIMCNSAWEMCILSLIYFFIQSLILSVWTQGNLCFSMLPSKDSKHTRAADAPPESLPHLSSASLRWLLAETEQSQLCSWVYRYLQTFTSEPWGSPVASSP